MNEEPSVLTRMRLGCCWGDNLNEKELNEVVDYINHLQKENKKYNQLKNENARLKEIENKLNFIKNRVKQGMSQENINKCAIELVNSYLKDILKEVE